MTELTGGPAAGIFGKMPALGDFVQRDLDAGFVSAWDDWLSQLLHRYRARCSGRWDEAYWQIPIWRFALGPDLAGGSAYLGVMAPSTDRVGRHYPLMIATRLHAPLRPSLAVDCSAWLDAAEQLLVETIDGDEVRPDELIHWLRTRLPVLAKAPTNGTAERVPGAPGVIFRFDGDTDQSFDPAALDAAFPEVATRGDTSLWWCQTSPAAPHRMLAMGTWPGDDLLEGSAVPEPVLPPDTITATDDFSEALGDLLGETPAAAPAPPAAAATDDAPDAVPPAHDPDATDPSFHQTLRRLDEESRRVEQEPAGISAGRTDVGCHRSANQDAILDQPERNLWVVADGMGGHSDGEIASQMIVTRLSKLPLSADPLQTVHRIDDCLASINRELRQLADQRSVDVIGSTVVLAFATERHWLIGWLGDSRCYAIKDQELVLLSRDHNRLEYWRECGHEIESLPPEETPKFSELMRAIGATAAPVSAEWRLVSKKEYSRLLLCSDGLSGAVRRPRIEQILRSADHPPDQVCNALVDEAIAQSCRDNVSVVVIDRAGTA